MYSRYFKKKPNFRDEASNSDSGHARTFGIVSLNSAVRRCSPRKQSSGYKPAKRFQDRCITPLRVILGIVSPCAKGVERTLNIPLFTDYSVSLHSFS